MKVFILAGKDVDSNCISLLPEGHEYTEVRLAAVSRGVRRLEKEAADCVVLIPGSEDATWSRAISRIRREYDTHVILLFGHDLPETEVLDLGAHDCLKMGRGVARLLSRSFRHLEEKLALERQLVRERELLEWMEVTDKFGNWQMAADSSFQWSKGIRRVLDVGDAEMLRDISSIRDRVHPDDWDIFDRANQATFETGWPLDFEYRVIGSDGKIRHLHVNRAVELGAGGEVVRACGLARDVSLYKEFEELLFRRDAILQVLAVFASRFLRSADWEEGFDKALAELGKATDVTRVYLFSKTGESGDKEKLSLKHEWAAEGIAPIMEKKEFHDQDFSLRHGAWRTAMLRRKVIAGNVKDFQKMEREVFEATGAKSIIIVPVFAGSIWWGFLGLSEHREERDWLPVEIESLTLAANIFGSAIHYGVMSEQLLEANKAAEEASSAALEANMAKSMFLANMSHEIRTPISGILGMAEMLITTGLNPEQREHVDMIRDGAGALLAIVNDVLDISKIEAGKMELKPVDYAFRRELKTCVRSFGPQAEANNILFRYSVDDDVPRMVNGDSDRLGQVLRNLINNAIKFTERGLVELNVSTTKRESDRVCLLFQVTDTGEGIPSDKLDSIFDVFIQADSSLRKKHQGTGLGLAISRQIVHMMGGEIGVESEVGRGSTFHFTAWFGIAEDVEPAVEEAKDKAPETLHLNILLAEDNPMNRKYLTHFLTMFGHTITTVENGIEVMATLEARGNEFEIVLMDVQMPQMSGIEATRAIRESDGRLYDRSIPIIALTAYAMKGDRERMIEAGMDDYVSKPVDMHELSDAIVRCMSGKAGKSKGVLEQEEVPQETLRLDMDALLARFDDNTALLKDILDLFILESEEKLANLERGIETRDPKTLGTALHSITNISSHVLAMDIVNRSRMLEKRCYLGELDEVVKEIRELKPRFKELVRAVQYEADKL